jgi:geranylgeranyl pyrophosphate synthase
MAITPLQSTEFLETLDAYKRVLERELSRMAALAAPLSVRLHEATRYVLEGQGKRLRGLLVMAVARDVGGERADETASLGAAVAVEMLHAASLVHDDLPALDNDDMRRGRPSCHRAFSEATAILVGDLLVGRALERVGQGTVHPEGQIAITMKLSSAWAELCMGQQLDIEKPSQPEIVERLMELKTGALFGVSAYAGAVCGGVSPQDAERFFEWGKSVGVLFQKLDDISDGDGAASESFNAAGEIARCREQLRQLAAGIELPMTAQIFQKIVGMA